MTPDEARELLARRSQGPPRRFSDAERRTRATARSKARSAAEAALARMHPDEFQALYEASLAEQGIA